MHILKIFQKSSIAYIPRSRPSSRLYNIFQVEKGERGKKDYSSLYTVSGLLFDYNIYFESEHLKNILKIINIFLDVDLPIACMTYFRWKKGKGEKGLH